MKNLPLYLFLLSLSCVVIQSCESSDSSASSVLIEQMKEDSDITNRFLLEARVNDLLSEAIIGGATLPTQEEYNSISQGIETGEAIKKLSRNGFKNANALVSTLVELESTKKTLAKRYGNFKHALSQEDEAELKNYLKTQVVSPSINAEEALKMIEKKR